MNLQTTIELYAGGPGSGCNPAAGHCGRLPNSHVSSTDSRLHDLIKSKVGLTQATPVKGSMAEKRGLRRGSYVRWSTYDLNEVHYSGSGHVLGFDSNRDVVIQNLKDPDTISFINDKNVRPVGGRLHAGGPGSGCNPAAGKCGRHAGPKKDPLAGFQNPKTASRSAKRAQKQQTKQARQAGFKPARVDKSFKTKQLPSIQQQQTFSPQEKVILTEDVVRGKKTSKAGEEAIVVNVLQQTPGQPQIYSVRLRNGHTEYLTHDQLARPALKGPQPQKPALKPLGGSKVKQSWTNADGSRYTEFFPKGGPKDSAPRDPFSTPHPLKGRFDRLTEDVYVKGSENRITSIYQAAAKSGVEGAGTTVFVHRYPGQQRVVVQEARTGQYNWQSSTLRQYEFGGKRSQVQSMKFTKTRYGISLKLPKMRF